MNAPCILIVENSPTQALRLEMELAAQGWSASSVRTAEEAFDQLNRESSDVVIVDFFLPGTTGADFCRRVRANVNSRKIPIIMLTADEHHEAELHCLESGADDFFKKSADTEILIHRVRAMLERSRPNLAVIAPGDSSFKQARVLAVDDSATYLSHLRGLLESEGYAVDAVANPRLALDQLEHNAYDLALIDLVMPNLDGIEVCRRIIAMRDRLDNPIAVLMLTGREAKEDLTRALEAGADDFVGKSSDQAVLKGRIRALLRRKFFQEENQRILEELKNKELETATARAEKEAALARAADERREHAEAVACQLAQSKAELEQSNDELLRSNDELRQFAFVASHDLQEPLRSITSFCNLLKEDCHERLGADAGEYIDRIVGGAARMKALVADLLSYSRVNLDEQNAFQTIELAAVVDDVLANLHGAIVDSQAEITCGDLPAVVGDHVQLVQLLQNLVGNAILYRSRDRAPRISIDALRGADHWELAVRDNGIGIAPEHHDRIFEIFKRLHGRTEYPGTGIGLAVCRKIVQRHGGRIWVHSRLGEGSQFRFTIHAPTNPEPDHDRVRQAAAAV